MVFVAGAPSEDLTSAQQLTQVFLPTPTLTLIPTWRLVPGKYSFFQLIK